MPSCITMMVRLLPIFLILLRVQSTTSDPSHQVEEIKKLKLEIEFLKKLILHQATPIPDISPSFTSPPAPSPQPEGDIEPTPSLWTTSVYTSLSIFNASVPTTTLVPINVGGLAGLTYTIVDTVTALTTSTATLTTSVRVSPSSVRISPTSVKVSPTSVMKSPTSTVPLHSTASSTPRIDQPSTASSTSRIAQRTRPRTPFRRFSAQTFRRF